MAQEDLDALAVRFQKEPMKKGKPDDLRQADLVTKDNSGDHITMMDRLKPGVLQKIKIEPEDN